MRWLTFSSNLVKEINTLPEFFLFQRFPKQVKGGFLIEGGTSGLHWGGIRYKGKSNWRKHWTGYVQLLRVMHPKVAVSCKFGMFFGYYMVTKDTLQHEVTTNLFKAIEVDCSNPGDCKFDHLCVGVINVMAWLVFDHLCSTEWKTSNRVGMR